MNPSLTKYQLIHCMITFSKALNPPQFSALFVSVVADEAPRLRERFSAGNSGGRRTKHHLWTVSQSPPVSENHERSPRPPRPRRAAQRGKHWQRHRKETFQSYLHQGCYHMHTFPFFYHRHSRTVNLSCNILDETD